MLRNDVLTQKHDKEKNNEKKEAINLSLIAIGVNDDVDVYEF